MHFLVFFSCLVVLSSAAIGYAPVPQVAPAPTSYGNPQQPIYIPTSQQQQQPFQQFPSNGATQNFNNPLPQAGQILTGNGNGNGNGLQSGFQGNGNGNGLQSGFQGQGPVSSLTGEDDWDSVITARGVKNVKLARQFRRQ